VPSAVVPKRLPHNEFALSSPLDKSATFILRVAGLWDPVPPPRRAALLGSRAEVPRRSFDFQLSDSCSQTLCFVRFLATRTAFRVPRLGRGHSPLTLPPTPSPFFRKM
jgi:hypothetical protein